METYIGKTIKANYWRGVESVGVSISFDEKGLTIKSRGLNIQSVKERVEYSQIVEVKKFNTMGIVPNSFTIRTRGNVIHKFVCFKRTPVIEFIASKI